MAQTINGVGCYMRKGTAYLDINDVAIGLGYTVSGKRNGRSVLYVNHTRFNKALRSVKTILARKTYIQNVR